MQIIENAQPRIRLDLRTELIAARMIDAHAESGLGNMQYRFAAASHQEHECRRNRHPARAIPSDAILTFRWRVEVFGRRDRFSEGRGVFNLFPFEKVASRRQQFDRAVDWNSVLLPSPGPHGPNRGMKVERRDCCRLYVRIERNDEAFIDRFA